MAEVMTDADAIGGSDTFVVVFDRHFRVVHRYVARRLGSEWADELAAETFARAFAARSSYDPRLADARPWLLGIATNLIRQHRRSEERRWRAYARSVVPDSLELGELAVSGAMDAPLAVGLASLPRGERDVLLLYAWFDLSYEEIAQALGLPVGTVRSRLNSARRRMGAAVAEGESSAHPAMPGRATRLEAGR
jgi:RNA polymerase sigma-70 factor (ECF subfamily)